MSASARETRSVIALAVVLVVVFGITKLMSPTVAAPRRPPSGPLGPLETITPEARAGTLRIGAGVDPADEAWIRAAIANARPEAQQLIAEVDGVVTVDTSLNRPGTPVQSHALGFMIMLPGGAQVSLDVTRLDGDRVIDRDAVVLHELGHVIDALLVSDAVMKQLDAGIPTVDTCAPAPVAPGKSCKAVEERFADTFAKWALGGRASLAGAGYGIPMPASIEDWGRPLGLLAAEVTIKAGG
jgi:hypothetical protein